MNLPGAGLPSRQKSAADVVRERLAPFLGPHTAKTAVAMTAKRDLGADADHLSPQQVPALLEALAPILRTLMGKEQAGRLIDSIQKELSL